MTDPIKLTPDGLESALQWLDRDSFVAFVADLYEQEGWEVARNGDAITASTTDRATRVFVFTEQRTRFQRVTNDDPDPPDIDGIDAVVTRERDVTTAQQIADEMNADLITTADLHNRLLFALDRERAQALCTRHFDREVELIPEADEEGGELGYVSQSRALVAIAILGLLLIVVGGSLGLPGALTPSADPQPGIEEPVGTSPVRPIGVGTSPVSTSPVSSPPSPNPPVFSLEANGSVTVSADSTVTINGTLMNPTDHSYSNLSVSLHANSSEVFAVPPSERTIDTLGPHTTRAVSWTLIIDAAEGDSELEIRTEYTVADGEPRRSVSRAYTLTAIENTIPPRFSFRDSDGPIDFRESHWTIEAGSWANLTITLTNRQSGNLTSGNLSLAVPTRYNRTNSTHQFGTPMEGSEVIAPNETTFTVLRPDESWSGTWRIYIPESARGEYAIPLSYSQRGFPPTLSSPPSTRPLHINVTNSTPSASE